MDNSVTADEAFFVAPYPHRPNTPWKMQIRASFAGKKICRFCATEAAAYEIGVKMTARIQTIGATATQNESLTLERAVQKFLPRLDEKSERHRAGAGYILGYLSRDLGKRPLSSINAHDLDTWLSRRKNSTTRATDFRYLRMLFRWADRFDLISKNPMKALDCPPSKPLRNILSPDQMKEILALEGKMEPWLFVSFLLGAFAGIRTIEVARMRWEDIDCKNNQIFIEDFVEEGTTPAEFSDRVVDFMPPLTRRKHLFQGKTGKIVPSRMDKSGKIVPGREDGIMCQERLKLLKGDNPLLNWGTWPKNCLRHSAATYHLAKCKNAGVTANWLGHKNSISLVNNVYAVPSRRADWKAWWAL